MALSSEDINSIEQNEDGSRSLENSKSSIPSLQELDAKHYPEPISSCPITLGSALILFSNTDRSGLLKEFLVSTELVYSTSATQF